MLAGEGRRIEPRQEWQELAGVVDDPGSFAVDPDYYVLAREVSAGE